jgi:hypothetical protein
MSWVLTAIGVYSPHFTVISRIVIVAVTTNPAFSIYGFFAFFLASKGTKEESMKLE